MPFLTTIPQIVTTPYQQVRKLFLLGGFVMLIMLPFVHNELSVPLLVSLFLIIILNVIAGFTYPDNILAGIFDIVSSLTAFVLFEYNAVSQYLHFGPIYLLFWINAILGMIFFFALYCSVKSLREIMPLKRHKQIFS